MLMRRIAAIATTIFLVILVSPASAHTVLVSSSPEKGSILESLPASISITFAENLLSIRNSNSISVLDEDGEEVSDGEVAIVGSTISKNLIASSKSGIFRVDYRAVAADGHVIQNSFSFTVTKNAVTTSTNEISPVETAPTESEEKLSIYFILSATAIIGASLILIFIWKKQAK